MKTPTNFVAELNEEQRVELRRLMKTSNEQVRRRAHAVLLSSRRYSVDQIAQIYEVDRDTVSNWLDRWKDHGPHGLDDQAGRGRPSILNEKEQKQAIKIVEKDPRSAQRSLSRIEKKTGKKISRDTLKRLLKKGNKTWKRIRRSSRGKRDAADFQASKAELDGFRVQAKRQPVKSIFIILMAPVSRSIRACLMPGKQSAKPWRFPPLPVIASTFWVFTALTIGVTLSSLKRRLIPNS
jgi:transposase